MVCLGETKENFKKVHFAVQKNFQQRERERESNYRPLSLSHLDYKLSLLRDKIDFFLIFFAYLIGLIFECLWVFSILVALLAMLDHEDFRFGDTNGGRGHFLGVIISIYKSLSKWFPSSSQVFYNLFHSYKFERLSYLAQYILWGSKATQRKRS